MCRVNQLKHPYIVEKIKQIKQAFRVILSLIRKFIKVFNKYGLIVADFIYATLVLVIDFLWDHTKRLYVAAEPLIFHLLGLA